MDHLLSKEKERVVWEISYLVLRDREITQKESFFENRITVETDRRHDLSRKLKISRKRKRKSEARKTVLKRSEIK